jgi:serine/threonine protein phosphatase PrpC
MPPVDVSPVTLVTHAPVVGRVSADRHYFGLPYADLHRLPSIRAEAGWLGKLWFQAAATAGRSHMAGDSGTSCQDSYCYAYMPDTAFSVIAVADGLGSHASSHIGATLACQIACQVFLSENPATILNREEAPVELFSRINSRLTESLGGLTRASTTLAVAVVQEEADSSVNVVLTRMGDPAFYVLTRGDSGADSVKLVALLEESHTDAPLNAVSASLPSADGVTSGVEVLRLRLSSDFVGLAVVTDGISNDLEGSEEVRMWCADRWRVPLDGYAMADSLRFMRRGSMDDRTAVVLLRAAAQMDRAERNAAEGVADVDSALPVSESRRGATTSSFAVGEQPGPTPKDGVLAAPNGGNRRRGVILFLSLLVGLLLCTTAVLLVLAIWAR